MANALRLTFPVGRLVVGTPYTKWDKDMKNQPLVIKRGPDAGKRYAKYIFKVAIPKGAETHWAQTEWGQKIYAVGNAAFPNVAASPQFAWKIEDGDSQVPDINRQGRKNCDTEGFPGHWVLKFSRPQVMPLDADIKPLPPASVFRHDPQQNKWINENQEDFVKCGSYVQVNAEVTGNDDSTKPGIFLNQIMIAFVGYGPEIHYGPDPEEAGFTTTMPAGASAVPLASAPLPAVNPPAVPSPIPVVPNPQFVQVPPPAPPAPPAPPVRQMTPAANGVTYEAYKAAGWSDEMLIANGMMLP